LESQRPAKSDKSCKRLATASPSIGKQLCWIGTMSRKWPLLVITVSAWFNAIKYIWTSMGTFEYHVTFRGGMLKPSGCRYMGKGGWPNRHITFIVAEKVLFTVPLTLFTVNEGVGWKVGIPSYGGGK